MKEDFISYLWENKLLYNNLVTIDGKTICIVNQGLKNANAGPDFLDARIMIGNTLWAGNIEIHVKASDWIKHGHEADAAYNNVVLHVVYDYDTDKVPIPTLAVKDKFKPNIYDDYQHKFQILTSIIEKADIDTGYLILGYPTVGNNNIKEAYALNMAASIFAGGQNSVLYKVLKEDEKVKTKLSYTGKTPNQ